jgi:hypothetical protein
LFERSEIARVGDDDGELFELVELIAHRKNRCAGKVTKRGGKGNAEFAPPL